MITRSSLISADLSRSVPDKQKTPRPKGTRGWRVAYGRSPLHKQEDAGGTHVSRIVAGSADRVKPWTTMGVVRRRLVLLAVAVGIGYVVARARRAAFTPEPDRDPWSTEPPVALEARA